MQINGCRSVVVKGMQAVALAGAVFDTSWIALQASLVSAPCCLIPEIAVAAKAGPRRISSETATALASEPSAR